MNFEQILKNLQTPQSYEELCSEFANALEVIVNHITKGATDKNCSLARMIPRREGCPFSDGYRVEVEDATFYLTKRGDKWFLDKGNNPMELTEEHTKNILEIIHFLEDHAEEKKPHHSFRDFVEGFADSLEDGDLKDFIKHFISRKANESEESKILDIIDKVGSPEVHAMKVKSALYIDYGHNCPLQIVHQPDDTFVAVLDSDYLEISDSSVLRTIFNKF